MHTLHIRWYTLDTNEDGEAVLGRRVGNQVYGLAYSAAEAKFFAESMARSLQIQGYYVIMDLLVHQMSEETEKDHG